MIETYDIILWKKNEDVNNTFEEIADETYETLSVLQDFPENLRPNYLKAYSKKNVKLFDWNYKNFKNILKEGVNKEGENIFEDLGYSVGFFSDLDDYKTCGISVHVGNKDPLFVNSLIIHLPCALNLIDCETVKMVKVLFEKLIKVFKPFWGCVSNDTLTEKYERYMENGIPTTVHWLNYWSDDIIEKFGREKLGKFINGNNAVTNKNGIISIRHKALYADNQDDVNYHDEIHKSLFL